MPCVPGRAGLSRLDLDLISSYPARVVIAANHALLFSSPHAECTALLPSSKQKDQEHHANPHLTSVIVTQSTMIPLKSSYFEPCTGHPLLRCKTRPPYCAPPYKAWLQVSPTRLSSYSPHCAAARHSECQRAKVKPPSNDASVIAPRSALSALPLSTSASHPTTALYSSRIIPLQ